MMIYIMVEQEYAASTWCSDICRGIYDQAKQKRIDCTMAQENVSAGEDDLIILAGNSPAWIYNMVGKLKETCAAHIILVSNTPYPLSVNNICTDLVRSMQEVLAYLRMDCGKKKIAFYGVNASSTTDLLKLQGFASEEGVYYSANDLRTCFAQFFQDIDAYDAVVCANDYAAISLIQNLKKCAPEQVSRIFIISFSNSRVAQVYRPSLSSVVLDYYEYGRTAVNLYRMLLKNPQISNLNVYIKSRIIPRETTGAISCNRNLIPESISHIGKNEFFEDKEIRDLVVLEKLFAIKDDTDQKIINALCKGYSYDQISQELFMSVNGIKYRLNRLFDVCGIQSRKELIEIYNMYFSENII